MIRNLRESYVAAFRDEYGLHRSEHSVIEDVSTSEGSLLSCHWNRRRETTFASRLHRHVIRELGSTAIAIVAIAASSLLTVPAGATDGPKLTWHLDKHSVNAGERPEIEYRFASLPQGSVLAIKILAGRSWRVVARASIGGSGAGSWIAPPVSQGRHSYSLDVSARDKKVLSSVPQIVLAYAETPLTAILGTTSQATIFNGSTFSFAWSATNWAHYVVANIGSSSCRSLKLTTLYIQTSPSDVAHVATLSIIQSAQTDSVNIGAGDIQTLSSRIDGPFEIAIDNAPGTAFGSGLGECWSKNGR